MNTKDEIGRVEREPLGMVPSPPAPADRDTGPSVPGARAVAQEGWLIPGWTSLEKIRCASVHVTAYHRPGHSTASSHTYCPVLLRSSGSVIELGDLVSDFAVARQIAEQAASATNLAFFENRP